MSGSTSTTNRTPIPLSHNISRSPHNHYYHSPSQQQRRSRALRDLHYAHGFRSGGGDAAAVHPALTSIAATKDLAHQASIPTTTYRGAGTPAGPPSSSVSSATTSSANNTHDSIADGAVANAVAAAIAAAAATTIPPAVAALPKSPVLRTSQHPQMSSSTNPVRAGDDRPLMTHRTASIDSNVSSLSSISHRPNGNPAARLSHEPTVPEDPAALIAAYGSAEAALNKILAEKQQAASHNAQLWRLVEKQRTMILGLNRDLEKSLKEKERYRKKLKESLAQSASAPNLPTPGTISRDDSRSPALSEAVPEGVTKPTSTVDISASLRKTSDSSDNALITSSRSDTPQDLPITTEKSAPPAVIASPTDASAATINATRSRPEPLELQNRPRTATNPISPPPMSAESYSSPKQRKAPPAPLNLAPQPGPGISAIADASDSEYEEEPESARSEFVERGRRKTREDDDREREAQVKLEDEQRSRSIKNKAAAANPKSSVDSDTASDSSIVTRPDRREIPPNIIVEERRPAASAFAPIANPTDLLRSRAAAQIQRGDGPTSLLSPGLPMSPRPNDRPPNSPMPRPPMTPSAMPMSPKSGMPLSPRPPTRPIPLPPQTPLGITSPHLDRAKTYQIQVQPPQAPSINSVVDRLKDENLDLELRPSMSIDSGEIYRGLVTEQYPQLLLPPNALPSIFIKTASSRMKPSRASIIASKGLDEIPVFTLGIHERSDNRQLWRVEKSYSSLAHLDQVVSATIAGRDKMAMPDKALFAGHAPVKVDARRVALNKYFDKMLDCVLDEKTAVSICRFLSSDAIPAEASPLLGSGIDRPDTPVLRSRLTRAGYLTKRGKNFGGWKARYFVLDGPNLKYFEGPGGAHLGSIKLQNAQIGSQTTNDTQQDEDNQFRHAFMILEPKKKDSSSIVRHVLCAESDAERDGWVDALLQYTDYKDGDDQPGRQGVSRPDFNPPKSPRLQKSMGEMRSPRDTPTSGSIGFGYNDAVAGDAPVMGSTPPTGNASSPTLERSMSEYSQTSHITISGPTNPKVIGNDWGMKSPTTPGFKDKKRSVFQMPFTRGRSSAELSGNEKSSAAVPATSPGARAVFGIPLAEAAEIAPPRNVNVNMPAVVYRCIEYLISNNATGEEGIFRLSGSNTVIRALKDRFNNEGDINLIEDEEYYDIHAVASLLKLYLRELPASILTRDLHLDFLQCLEHNGDEKVVQLNALVYRLPGANRAVLEALCEFLLMIVENVAVNKMNVRNLGVVFAPTLNLTQPLITILVEEQHRIFGPPLSPPARSDSVAAYTSATTHSASTDYSTSELRSPRKQMFSSELATPAYHQTTFPLPPGVSNPLDANLNNSSNSAASAGMVPLRPAYPAYQMAPQSEGGFGSLNDLLQGTGVPTSRSGSGPGPVPERSKRRESGAGLGPTGGGGAVRKNSALGKTWE